MKKDLVQSLMGAWLFATVITVGGCAASSQTLTDPAALDRVAPAHGVAITASLRGRSAVGDTVVLTYTNVGSQAAYMPRCGSQPLVLTQQFVNGDWVGGVQNFMCVAPSAPGPVELAPGGTLQIVRVFDTAGRYRFFTTVGAQADLTDGDRSTSNAVDVP